MWHLLQPPGSLCKPRSDAKLAVLASSLAIDRVLGDVRICRQPQTADSVDSLPESRAPTSDNAVSLVNRSLSTHGACRRTGGVRPGLALRELLQRGVREALAGCVDGLRVRPGGQRRVNRRDVIDNTRESDVIRPDVVPTSGRA